MKTPGLNRIYQGDALAVLKTWPDAFINTCVTSPPYWGLRDYGMAGQLGLEKTPEEYVDKMVTVFCEVRRVLRDDGTLWLNIGDSYSDLGRGEDVGSTIDGTRRSQAESRKVCIRQSFKGVRPKNLIGVPWMLAFALREDGWYLRSDIIWAKPNPMPESVTDRPTKAHEYLFLLSKRESYFYDYEEIREPPTEASLLRWVQDVDAQAGSLRVPGKNNGTMKAVGGPRRKNLPETQVKLGELRNKQRGHSRRHAGFNDRWDNLSREEQMSMGRNKRTVWTVATQPFKEHHFATFPPDLIKPCILAGSRSGGGHRTRPIHGRGDHRSRRLVSEPQVSRHRTQLGIHQDRGEANRWRGRTREDVLT